MEITTHPFANHKSYTTGYVPNPTTQHQFLNSFRMFHIHSYHLLFSFLFPSYYVLVSFLFPSCFVLVSFLPSSLLNKSFKHCMVRRKTEEKVSKSTLRIKCNQYMTHRIPQIHPVNLHQSATRGEY